MDDMDNSNERELKFQSQMFTENVPSMKSSPAHHENLLNLLAAFREVLPQYLNERTGQVESTNLSTLFTIRTATGISQILDDLRYYISKVVDSRGLTQQLEEVPL